MIYKTRPQRGVHFLLALMLMPLLLLAWDSVYMRAAIMVVMIINILALFINYKCIIGADFITFSIYLFQLKLYEKRADKIRIKQIIFKRAGWKTKSAAIKMNGGFPLRLVSFMPDTLMEELIAFCEANNISYNKTKDFLLLEKMSSVR